MADVSFDLRVAKKYAQKANNAKQRGIEFSLSLTSMKNLCRAKRCYYTGMQLTQSRHGSPMRDSDMTIERIDPSKGYVKGNVAAVCHAANAIKNQIIEDPNSPLDLGMFTRMVKLMNKKSK